MPCPRNRSRDLSRTGWQTSPATLRGHYEHAVSARAGRGKHQNGRERTTTHALWQREGSVAVLTKQLSDVEVALFGLVNGDHVVTTEEPCFPVRTPRQAVPLPLLGALLAAAAAKRAARPGAPTLIEQHIRSVELAYSDDT